MQANLIKAFYYCRLIPLWLTLNQIPAQIVFTVSWISTVWRVKFEMEESLLKSTRQKIKQSWISRIVNGQSQALAKHLAIYRHEVDKGKLTAVASFEKLMFRALALR